METETCISSMDFKVQELLKEVRLQCSPALTKLVDDTVSAIKSSLDKIPQDLQVTVDWAPDFVRDIGADKAEFKFKKPKSIEIGGSYSIGCVAKPDVNIDLLLRLPKECFHEKDYLNYRYHAKRCLYLCVIKKYLKSSSSIQKVEWSTLQNEARKPVLVVYPDANLDEAPGLFIRIIPTATSLFDPSKLNEKRNNVRALKTGDVLQPTPIYNCSILEDMYLEENSKFVMNFFSGWKELGEALILLKVWARLRSSIYVHDCINGFLISVIVSYLVAKNKINHDMMPMGIFRATLKFIETYPLWKHGLYFPTIDRSSSKGNEQLNSSTCVNLAFRISGVAYPELQDEVALTLRCLERCREGGFEEIFATKIDNAAKYDYCFRLNLKGNREVASLGFCLDDECWRVYEQDVHSLLYQGLTDRAKFIRVIWRNTYSDFNVENGLSALDSVPLFVGILVSSVEKAFRVVDIGPNAEKKDEALMFRKFWGEKAELRRFQDGKIAESTVWESEQGSRHLILKRIVEFLLGRHLSLLEKDIVSVVDQLDFSLLLDGKDPVSHSGKLLGTFEELSKRLCSIEDVPLRISSVQPLDSAFRYTSVFPPETHPVANKKVDVARLHNLTPFCVQSLEVMIQASSGNWPMNDVLIEKTKSVFLLKIAESLQDNWGMTCIASEEDVDVFMDGYAFRLRILHERGLSLVGKEIGHDQTKRVSAADKMLFVRSQHASMVNGLQFRYPIFGPVVRLAKRWLASHLFSACLAEEAVELLVAHLFLKPLPFDVPCSRITGFLRFLRLLAEYDWTFSTLIVDINGDLSQNDEKEIDDHFTQSRKAYKENTQIGSKAMFLATAYDKSSEAWTRCSPNPLELKRLVAYSRSSANFLTKLILQNQTDPHEWECLFRTPLSLYDAVILLHGDRLPYPKRLLFTSELDQGRHVAHGSASNSFHPFLLPADMNCSLEQIKTKQMVNFDPLRCFVGDVEKEFSNRLTLWYDSLGGDAIGLTWERSKKREREEEEMDGKYPVDLLRNVGELGKGFVRDVYLLKAPRLEK
ncbi:putative ADP-ribosylation factor [Hibiscus syriacus]|uniref:ADP-ribosylation factor n=1 Tax=Hibiscus syriacus TaxID=106335 RepID=A0A6A2WMW5_HIBSY|nr:putative ADP-ribosylation factor [Hibiscus syriacus]